MNGSNNNGSINYHFATISYSSVSSPAYPSFGRKSRGKKPVKKKINPNTTIAFTPYSAAILTEYGATTFPKLPKPSISPAAVPSTCFGNLLM